MQFNIVIPAEAGIYGFPITNLGNDNVGLLRE